MALQTQTPQQIRSYYRQLAEKWESLTKEAQERKLNLDALSDAELAAALTDANMTVNATQANQLKSMLATISTTAANNQANLTAAFNAFLGIRTD